MTEKTISIGVDVGGSHVASAAVDLARGEVLEHTHSRTDVDSMADAPAIFDAWSASLASTLSSIDKARLAGIGFAMPGPFDYLNGISRMEHKFPGLFGMSIAESLGPLLGVTVPMRFLNDATSFAVGEAWLGEGSGVDRVLAITLGTGFGSAFIDRGIPVVERDDVPGEGCLWYLPYRDGIADEYFTTRWFVKHFEEVTGRRISGAKEVAARAAGGDPSALSVFEHYGENLAGFLAPWLAKFQADVVVLGGNISQAFEWFGPSMENGLASGYPGAKVRVSSMGEHAAMIGSARLLDEEFWRHVSVQLPTI